MKSSLQLAQAKRSTTIFRTILVEGDEVILPAPSYPGYVPVIELCGAKVNYLDTTDTAFQPSRGAFEKLITDKTKVVLFNYPIEPNRNHY